MSAAEEQAEKWRQLIVATEERLAQARRDLDAALERGDVDAAIGYQGLVQALDPVVAKLAAVAERRRFVLDPLAALYAHHVARNAQNG